MNRNKLEELNEEKLVRMGIQKPVTKSVLKRRRFVQIDCELFFSMTEKLSKTATRISTLMLRDMNPFTNIFSGTQEEIQQELELTENPVMKAMAELRTVDFMRKYKNGRYMVNPAVGIGCSEDYLPKLIDTYNSLQSTTPNKKIRRDAK